MNYSESVSPGVGAYFNVDNRNGSAPKYSFGKTVKSGANFYKSGDFNNIGGGVGPKYNVTSLEIYKTKSPSYSIKGKGNSGLNKTYTPGPGQYNNNSKSIGGSEFNKSQGFSIPKSKKESNVVQDNIPGPGQYKYDSGFSRPKSSAYSFIHSKKDPSFINLNQFVPGPGAYSNNNNSIIANEGKGYSMGKSKKGLSYIDIEKKLNSNVGPGKYDIEGKFSNKPNSGGFKIGSQKRDFNYNESISPGPGQYSQINNLNSKINSGGYSFGKSLKLNSSIASDSGIYSLNTTTPGPGKYNQHSCFENSGGYSFSKSVINNKVNQTPGPGYYNDDVSKIKPNHQRVFIGSSGGSMFTIGGSNNNPGPGYYSLENSRIHNNSQSFVFNKQNRFQNKNDQKPGPGQYHIPCSIRDVNDYSVIGGNFDMKFKYI